MPFLSDSSQLLACLLLAGVGGLIIWAVWRGRAAFVVRIRDGKPQITQGTVSGAFLRDLEEICQRQELVQGRIRGVRRGRNVLLEFSRHIPSDCRQQIRNVWSFSG